MDLWMNRWTYNILRMAYPIELDFFLIYTFIGRSIYAKIA